MDRLDNTPSIDGFGTYSDIMKYWLAIESLIPKGVAQRVETRLNFKFIQPWKGGKRVMLASDCPWSISGINEFLDKCIRLRQKLNECKRSPLSASEFEAWFNQEIVPKSQAGIDDRLTYRQIFTLIEEEYYQGKHKFTGEKRLRDSASAKMSFSTSYQRFFKRCPDPDAYPNWDNVRTWWEAFPENAKQYEALGKIKKVISYCPDNIKKELLLKLNRIKVSKPKPTNRKSIDWEQFFNWYKEQKDLIKEMPEFQALAREGWLWIYKVSIVYGLRPAEVMSAINLFNPISDRQVKILWGEKGKQYGDSSNINPAFNDRNNNPKMLLILGNGFTVTDTSGKSHFITNKTGGRFCYPLCRNKEIMDFLDIQSIPYKLPEYQPDAASKSETIAGGFAKNFNKNLERWGCPTTQGYSFRHLGKMLGKLSGIPPSIIADNMGHTLSASEQYYNRKTIGMANDIAASVASYPLPLDIALGELEQVGIDTEDKTVKEILKIIYQLENF